MHALQRLLRLFRAEARRMADHHVGQADDGIERGAQLVAHAGDELRLVFARLLQLPVLVLDFVEQAHILDRDHGLIGKVVASSIWRSVNGWIERRASTSTPVGAPWRRRGTPRMA